MHVIWAHMYLYTALTTQLCLLGACKFLKAAQLTN